MEHKKMESDSSHPSGDDSVARFGCEHTPGPMTAVIWQMPSGELHHAVASTLRPEVGAIALTGPVDAPDDALSYANAARIVQCVNAHDDMLKALRRAVVALAFAAESSPAMRDDYEAVSAAIAKATA